MPRVPRILSSLAAALLLAWSLGCAAEARPLVLRHATAFIGPELTPTPEVAIEIDGGVIRRVGPEGSFPLPADAETLDLTGRFVLPGFIEMHAHLLLHPWKEDGSIAPQFDREATLAILRLLLAAGITTVRDPGAPTEAAVVLRQMVARGDMAGPRIVTTGRMLNGSPFDPEPFAPMTDAAGVRREIRWQRQAGVDFVKVYSSMPPELVRAAVAEAHALGLPVAGHLGATSWTDGAEAGIDVIEHPASWSLDLIAPERRGRIPNTMLGRVDWLEQLDLAAPAFEGMLGALVRHRVTVDPTLIAMHSKFWGDDPRYTGGPELARMPASFRLGWPRGSFTASWTPADYERARKAWPKLLAHTRRLFEAGVPLTVGTDTPSPWIVPGASFVREMELLESAGIPRREVLKMATVNAARALGQAGKLGQITPGATADFVVLDGDPLASLDHVRRVRWVIQGGRPRSPEDDPSADKPPA